MKIKELSNSFKDVEDIISELRINEFHFENFGVMHHTYKELEELEIEDWHFTPKGDENILIIHAREESQDSEELEESLTVSDVLSLVCYDRENTIVVYDYNDTLKFDSDEDDMFALCKMLNLEVKEYVQIHKGKHQTIEIHLSQNDY